MGQGTLYSSALLSQNERESDNRLRNETSNQHLFYDLYCGTVQHNHLLCMGSYTRCISL